MPTFSKFITSQRGAEQLLDSPNQVLTHAARAAAKQLNKPPSVQEYVRAVREEQVMTDYHLDRLSVGKTPSRRRRTCHTHLYDICSFYSTYPSKIEYVFAVAKYFGNDIE